MSATALQATLGFVILLKKAGQPDPSFDRAYTPAAFFSLALDQAVSEIDDSKSVKKFASNLLNNVRDFAKDIQDEVGIKPGPKALCIIYPSQEDAQKAIDAISDLWKLKSDLEIKPVLVSFTSMA